MTMQEYIAAAKWLAAEDMMLHPLAQLDSIPTSEEQQVLAETESGILTADAAIAAACGDIDPRTVFLSAHAGEQALQAGSRAGAAIWRRTRKASGSWTL